MSFAGPLESRIAIYELQHEYGDAVTRHDREAWLNCWDDNGVWEFSRGTFSGKSAIAAEWDIIMEHVSGGLKGSDIRFFSSFPGALQIDGERAHDHVFTNELLQNETGEIIRMNGRYDDIYINRHGRWMFQNRRHSVLLVDSNRRKS